MVPLWAMGRGMKLSLIVGSINRSHLLRYCIPSWFRFTKPDELVLINDGMKDDTEAIFNEWREREPGVNFIYKYSGNPKYRNPTFAHNWGAKTASSEIVAFTDPEVMFVTDAIGILKMALEEDSNRHVGVGTLYRTRAGVRLSSEELADPMRIIQRPEIVTWQHGHVSKDTEITKFENVMGYYFGGCTKELYLRMGGKDERFVGFGAEDIDFFGRLSRCGILHFIHNEIIAIHLYHEGAPRHAMELAAKNFEMMLENERNRVVVANEGQEWGRL